jgi:uncharacterized protein (DUF885 family)
MHAMTIQPAQEGRSQVDAAARLAALADEFWEGCLAWSPTYATVLGDRRFDARLEDRSREAQAAERDRLRGVLAEAARIDPAALAGEDRLTLAALQAEAGGQLDGLEAGLEDWTVDPMNGIQTFLLDLPDYQPIRTPREGADYLERIRAVGPAIDNLMERLRASLAEGRVAVHQPVARVIDELLETAWAEPADWSLVRPAKELEAAPPEGWAPGEAAELRRGLEAAVREIVSPAFARYWELLRSEILPKARPPEQAGLRWLEGGEEAYARLARAHTTTSLTPEELHRLGLDELERIDAEMTALGRKVLGTPDLASTLARLGEDPALRFQTRDEILETARANLARAEAAMPAWFGRLPVAPCEVLPVPAWSEAHQTIAYYAWPSADGSRPGRFWVNLSEPETRPRYEAAALAFHESIPGHHLQIAIAQELTDLPAFRRFLGATSFVEGWGLYTERLSDEMGLYPTDLDRIGILSFDAWRASRLVVDTGIHAFGWSRDRAVQLIRDHTALGGNNILNEVDRYIVWPGQALAYKVGQLELLRLREAARAALGDRFDIRRFHDVILSSGALPLGVLADHVERWIAAGGPAIGHPGDRGAGA